MHHILAATESTHHTNQSEEPLVQNDPPAMDTENEPTETMSTAELIEGDPEPEGSFISLHE